MVAQGKIFNICLYLKKIPYSKKEHALIYQQKKAAVNAAFFSDIPYY